MRLNPGEYPLACLRSGLEVERDELYEAARHRDSLIHLFSQEQSLNEVMGALMRFLPVRNSDVKELFLFVEEMVESGALASMPGDDLRTFLMLHDQLTRMTMSQPSRLSQRYMSFARKLLGSRMGFELFLTVASRGALLRVMSALRYEDLGVQFRSLLDRNGKEIEDEVFDLFYDFIVMEDEPRALDTDYVEAISSVYDVQLATRRDFLSFPIETDEWLFSCGDGINSPPEEGEVRVYLNVYPEFVSDVLGGISERLVQAGVGFEMKAPLKMKESSMKRADKMVIYFDLGEREKVRSLINDFYRMSFMKFAHEVPKFTVPWRIGPSMDRVRGIAVAVDPNGNFSYNELIARILATVVLNAHKRGVWAGDESFDFEGEFNAVCQEFGCNAEIPALNLDGDPRAFFELVTGKSEYAF